MAAKREVPRWQRSKQRAAVDRERAKMAREVAKHLQANGAPVTLTKQAGSMAAPPAFRYRRHYPPLIWLAVVLAVGAVIHHGHRHAAGLAVGLVLAVVVWFASRHLSRRGKLLCAVMAALTLAWIPVLGYAGVTRVTGCVAVLCWAVLQGCWSHHYRIRAAKPSGGSTDHEKWNALAAEKKWNGPGLGTAEQLAGGGRRYPLQLDGIKTTIGNVLSASENVAGAWHKPMTEAYVERDPHGITSRGYLTVLGTETLMRVREWKGAGMDPATGLAMIGRFADGSPCHVKFYTPRYGVRHALISGTTGSGKTELLNLLIFVLLVTGWFVPVILDPQEGQSLPFWRKRCLYAAGVTECERMLTGLHAGMLDRSRYLADLSWDNDGIGMEGMSFFDYQLTGLPMPVIIFDEAHMVLKGDTKANRKIVEKTVEIGRLGRKTGTGLWLATHVPSLDELGNQQALRDMLRGGNVISMRTANKVASHMLGLSKDPSEIPSFFRDGKETYGLGYCAGPDSRPDAPMRSDLVAKAMLRKVPPVPSLDPRFMAAMNQAMRRWDLEQEQEGLPGVALSLVKTADEMPDTPGRTCQDAILKVFSATAGPLDVKDIRDQVAVVAAGWERPKAWGIRAIADALKALTECEPPRLVKPGHGIYALPRASLQLAGTPGGNGTGGRP